MSQKTAIKLFERESFLKIFKKREINSMFFCFSFHLFNDEVINLLVGNKNENKNKKKHI